MSAAVEQAEAIRKTARDWIVELSGAPSDDARQRLEAWLAADPRHRAAYERTKALWDDAAQLRELDSLIDQDLGMDKRASDHGADLSPSLAKAVPNRRRRFLAPLAAAAAAAALVVAALPALLLRSGTEAPAVTYAQTAATQIAEIRELTLPDGSIVTVGARSEIDVTFTDGARRVGLISGEAFFDVAPDAERPFIVQAGATEVQVLGTQFDVSRSEDRVRVAVLEGVVEVIHAAAETLARSGESPAAPSDSGAVTRVLEAGRGGWARRA